MQCHCVYVRSCMTSKVLSFIAFSLKNLMFDLILYVLSTIFQLNRDWSSWVEPVLSKDKCVLLKDNNAVKVRLEPAAPRSRVKHSTTEPLRSLKNFDVMTRVVMLLGSCKKFPHARIKPLLHKLVLDHDIIFYF